MSAIKYYINCDKILFMHLTLNRSLFGRNFNEVKDRIKTIGAKSGKYSFEITRPEFDSLRRKGVKIHPLTIIKSTVSKIRQTEGAQDFAETMLKKQNVK